jgi:acetyltransferase-like isoleucine patch superfamily enzyme
MTSIDRQLFLHHSYAMRVLWSIMNLLPPFARSLLFRRMFKSYGSKNMIDYGCYFRYPKKISIGSECSINRNCQFFASRKIASAYIRIGNNVTIAPGVVLLGAGHDHSSILLPDIAASIVIEDNVWIGASSIVRYGVTISENAVVAAGSVVIKDVGRNEIVGGNPARLIQMREIQN